MTSTAPLLEIKGLQAGYGEAEVLHGIGLSMLPGEFLCIIGANTAGKSTILRSVSRLVPRITGTLRFEGTDLMARASHEIPALGIAHVPEGRQIFPDMNVEENLLLGAFTSRKAGDLPVRMNDVYAVPAAPRAAPTTGRNIVRRRTANGCGRARAYAAAEASAARRAEPRPRPESGGGNAPGARDHPRPGH